MFIRPERVECSPSVSTGSRKRGMREETGKQKEAKEGKEISFRGVKIGVTIPQGES